MAYEIATIGDLRTSSTSSGAVVRPLGDLVDVKECMVQPAVIAGALGLVVGFGLGFVLGRRRG